MAIKSRGNLRLRISFDNKANYGILPEPKSVPYDLSRDSIDATHLDSGDWKEMLPDKLGASISYQGNFVPGNPVLTALEAAAETGGLCHVERRLGQGATAVIKVFQAVIKSFSTTGADVVEVSCSFESTGAVTAS